MLEASVIIAAFLANMTIFSTISEITKEDLIPLMLRSMIYWACLISGLIYFTISLLRLYGILTYSVRYEDPYDIGYLWFLAIGIYPSFKVMVSGSLAGSILGLVFHKSKGVYYTVRTLASFVVMISVVLLILFFYL